jgi:iron complex transport system ATP-binding protein
MPETDNINCNPSSNLIEFNNASINYQGQKILDSLSFNVAQGEHIAIIGPNGSGKSSLIKSVTRDYYPVGVNDIPPVKIFGEDTWNIVELRKLLGIVSPDRQELCNKYISGKEMVLSGFFSSVGLFFCHTVTEEMENRANEVIEFLGIERLVDKTMKEMSSGEARLVLIAQALVHDPRALILDEPTNSLDFRATRQFRDTVRKIAQSGKSIILVTHNLQDIIPEIKRVILFKEGKIFQDGMKEEVLNSENLCNLFDTPLQVRCDGGYYSLCDIDEELDGCCAGSKEREKGF